MSPFYIPSRVVKGARPGVAMRPETGKLQGGRASALRTWDNVNRKIGFIFILCHHDFRK